MAQKIGNSPKPWHVSGLYFFLLFFSFSLILKRKEESKEGATEKQGVARKAEAVAFLSKTVAGSLNKFNELQTIATEPRFFSRHLVPNGRIWGGIGRVRI
ncbi:hypothetical protein [Pandoraea sp. XY-2]|uniref:hypothetical protein n=1 Tax=Pandoraea sp. XY-2 TaxID=2518599 RepID=UPI00101ED130|nr:hypothetical protein [Pandoraea sp. XY-2]